jgi:hypothetical protein
MMTKKVGDGMCVYIMHVYVRNGCNLSIVPGYHSTVVL